MLCHKSKFILKNKKGQFFKVFYYEEKNKENNKIEVEINFESLLELRDRAQLTKNIKENKDELETIEILFRKFLRYIIF